MASSLSSMIASPTLSLVKYETPILVSNKPADGIKSSRAKGTKFSSGKDHSPSPKIPRHGPKNKDQMAEILDAILPPREYEEGGKLWIQFVSRTPATRADVINLQGRLDIRLYERKAKELGICPVRRELYDQCFDELIRQETLNCTERGLLLVRIRDELRMTLAAYETLYDSSIAFGIRKALLSERGKINIQDQVNFLLMENVELRDRLKEQEVGHSQKQKQWEQCMALENKKFSDEVDFLKKTNHQLKVQLEAIIVPQKEEEPVVNQSN